MDKNETGIKWYQRLLQFVPLLTALVSVAGFLWGIQVYRNAQDDNRAASKKRAELENTTREREFMTPWLESQRKTYEEALDAAATAATSSDPKLRAAANDLFWQFFYGRMILVETTTVSSAMQDVGTCLRREGFCTDKQKTNRTLKLASAMAVSMAATAKMTYEEFAKNQFRYDTPGAPRVVLE